MWRAVRSAATLALVLGASGCGGGDDQETPLLGDTPVELTTGNDVVMTVASVAPIQLGANDLVVTFPKGPATLVRASAIMPAHGHGSDEPVIEHVGDQTFVRNLVFYMAGRWEVRFEVQSGDRASDAWLSVDVP